MKRIETLTVAMTLISVASLTLAAVLVIVLWREVGRVLQSGKAEPLLRPVPPAPPLLAAPPEREAA